MALITTQFSPTTALFNVRAVDAGDADEMVSRLSNAVLAALAGGEINIVDFKLTGAGSGPEWEAWFMTAAAGTPVTCALAQAQFVAAVAGNIPELILRLKQKLFAASPTPGNIFKLEIAGAGDGPTYMAVALFQPGQIG